MNETPSEQRFLSAADALQARIALAEQAVIARDERIRGRARDIADRLQGSALRNAGVGAAAGAGALLLSWLLGRRHGPAPAARPEARAEECAREAGLSLAGLLPLVWPFMPRKVRASVTPGLASAVLAILAPLAGRLFGRRAASRRRG